MPDLTSEQLRPDGSLRHLLTLQSLSRTQLEALLERAAGFVRPLGTRPAMSQALSGATVANLFTEPSTRTRVSFELAAKRLGADVVNLEVQLSSRVKGESMLDTVYTLEALHVDAFVIRDAELPEGAQYFAAWGLTPERLAGARPDAIVMHPQPMNRGIEIASDVADGPQSVIRDQVRNGVAVRMAVLADVLTSRGTWP
jgi:aspartate carbamoyltransferase catalytic subunit